MTGSGVRVRIIVTTVILLLCSLRPVFAQTPDPAFEQVKSYLFGRDATALDKITALVQQSRSIPAQRAEVAAELASILTSDASFDAKQFACRQLVFVAGEPEISALATLLNDDRLCHYALKVLAVIPGKAIDDALATHITNTHGADRLELLEVLANRDDSRAVPELARFLMDHPARAASAAAAIARISPPGALDVLVQAYHQHKNSSPAGLANALLQAAYRQMSRNNSVGAAAIFAIVDRDILDRDADSPQVRAAALRGLVLTSANPVSLIVKALSEDGTPRQRMAAESVNDVPGAHATRAFAAALPHLTPRGQVLLLTALGNRGDEAASAGIMALSRSTDPDIRLAVLKALGQVGNGSAVSLLLRTAAGGTGLEQEAARQSLARLHDDRMDKELASTVLSDSDSASIRIEAITAIGNRRAAGAVPEIMHAAAEENGAVSGAAFAVLRDIAPPAQLSTVLTLTLSLPSGSRDAAIEAAAEIARRGTTEAQRTGPLLSALQNAKKPADKLTLLTILDQVGGPAALRSLESAVSDSEQTVSQGALSLIAEWPSDEPMDLLLRIIRSPGEPRRKSIALRGYLKMVGSNELRPPDSTLALYRNVSAIAQRADDKRQILSGTAKVHTLPALQFASGFLKDNDVKAEAEASLVTIGRSTVGAFPRETREALEPVAASAADESVRKLAAEVLTLPAKATDFIIAWEVSPSYQRDGVNYTQLFDMPFPPETAAADKQTPWRLMPIVTNPEQPWLLDLLALWGGEQRVAYLRTAVGTDAPRDLTLELGSDDGVKAWLNGKVVLADNTQRGLTPGQEKIKVHLNAGWNTLLLKITQNVLGWGACARFTGPDGNAVTGLRYSVPSAVK